jgi:hypothetical protein
MMKRLLFFFLFFSLLASSTLAQDASPWSVYLYNSTQSQLVAVRADGSQTVINLGVTGNSYLSQSELAISSDGSQLAFCLVTSAADGTPSGATVIILDSLTASTRLNTSFAGAIGCHAGAFDETGSRLAIGLVNQNLAAADPNVAPTWEALILESSTGAILNTLTQDAPMLATVDPTGRWVYLPVFRQFVGEQATFALVPWATEAGDNLPAFTWTPATGDLIPVLGWGNLSGDALPNGEVIWLESDPSLPAGNPGGPMPSFNVLRLVDASGETRTIFQSPDWLPFDVKFVNGGQQILIAQLESFNPDNPAQPRTRLLLLDRNGGISEVGMFASFVDIEAAPDGYVLFWAEDTGGQAPPPLRLELRAAGGVRELWGFTSDNMGVSWNVVGAAPQVLAEALPPFPSVP